MTGEADHWFGSSPPHWTVAPVYARYEVQLGKMLNTEATRGDHLAPYLRNSDVQWDRVRIDDLPHMNFTPDQRKKFELRTGDLLVCEGGEVGRTAIWRGELPVCFFQKAVHRLRARKQTDLPRYLYYLMAAAAGRGAFVAGGNKSTIVHLTAEKLRVHRFPFPPLEEQRAIASFLDRKTAAIDELIKKKERLIELLQEKRQALITESVTKGLDPSVPMKDSGIEWLGEIPAHWRVVPSKWLFTESKRRAQPGDEQLSATQAYGVIAQAEFERLEGRQVVHSLLHLEKRKHVELDDFVISMRSFQGGLERAYATGCIRSSYVVLRPSAEVHVPFFASLLKSAAYIQALQATANFIRDGQDMNFGNFALVQLPLIPIADQQAIAKVLDTEIAWMDRLRAKLREGAALLQEYRQALITAAVTGKIDVSREAA